MARAPWRARFVGGTLSPESLARFADSLERLASEFESLARHDPRLPLERRNNCGAIVAVRSWEFPSSLVFAD